MEIRGKFLLCYACFMKEGTGHHVQFFQAPVHIRTLNHGVEEYTAADDTMARIGVHVITILSWMKVSDGLRCPTCTYLTTDESLPSSVNSQIDHILREAQSPECAQNLKETIQEVTEEFCEDISGKEPRCVYFKGSLNIRISDGPLGATLKLYQRGCYSFNKTSQVSDGCHDRINLDEDRTVIQQHLGKAISTQTNYTVGEFEGSRCLCSKSYCSGVKSTAIVTEMSNTAATDIPTSTNTTTAATKRAATGTVSSTTTAILTSTTKTFSTTINATNTSAVNKLTTITSSSKTGNNYCSRFLLFLAVIFTFSF